MMAKTFAVPVVWQMSGTEYIQADSLLEAMKIAQQPTRPLPSDRRYIDDSYEVQELIFCLEANDIPEELSSVKSEDIVEELRLRTSGNHGKASALLEEYSSQELEEFLSDIYGMKISG